MSGRKCIRERSTACVNGTAAGGKNEKGKEGGKESERERKRVVESALNILLQSERKR